jgi:hypothetical protein
VWQPCRNAVQREAEFDHRHVRATSDTGMRARAKQECETLIRIKKQLCNPDDKAN